MDNKTLTIAVLAMAVVGLAGATAYYQHQSTQTLEALQVNAAYSHAWRSLNNIHADHVITSMPITQ